MLSCKRSILLIPFVVLMILVIALLRVSALMVRASGLTEGTEAPHIEAQASMTPSVFGAQVYPRRGTTVISHAVEANLSWIRYDGSLYRNGFSWFDVEAEQGVYDWSALDLFEEEISILNEAQLTPIVVVRQTPPWAQKVEGFICGPIKEEALDDFADFMREAVKRYSVPPYNVKYWELWNEPDVEPGLGLDSLFGCWGDPDDAYYGGEYYAEMLKEVYPAIKEADPEAQVIVGGLLLNCDPTHPPPDRDCKPGKFLQGILENDGGDYFDMVGYHAYAFWKPAFAFSGDWDLEHAYWTHRGGITLGKADFLREVMSQYQIEKPLILGEMSLLCHEGNPYCWCDDPKIECLVDEFFAAQANYAIRVYSRLWAADVSGGIWFMLHFNSWRLADLLGPGDVPKPVYESVQFMSGLLSGATYAGNLSTDTVEGYRFLRGQREYQIYWTNFTTTSASLTLPVTTRAVYDQSGADITPNDLSITLTFSPTIIEIGAPLGCEATIWPTKSGNWNNPANWNANRVPNHNDVVWIPRHHSVTAPPDLTVRALCNEGRIKSQRHNELSLLVSDFVLNFPTGEIVGQDGSDGTAKNCGIPGSSVTIQPPSSGDDGEFGVAITNRGIIRGGNGGNGSQCAADGGSVYLLGRNSSNESTGYICGGKGGSLLGADGRAGKGGDTTIIGHFGGDGALGNQGMICSGDGGDVSARGSMSQYGGDGGELIMVTRPTIDLGAGRQKAGRGGQGSQDSARGQEGDIWIAPDGMIDLSGTHVEGGDITISAGDDGLLELTEMNGHVISASASITLAVGTGGVIDLRGNQEPILEAKQQILIASDQILLDEGTVLTDIVHALHVMTNTVTLPRYVSLIAPQAIVARPAITQAIELTILNNGALSDTYTLTVTDSADWSLSALPTSITVEGLDSQTLLLSVTPPLNSSSQSNTITVTVTSQSDQNVRQEAEIDIFVQYETYLPMISR